MKLHCGGGSLVIRLVLHTCVSKDAQHADLRYTSPQPYKPLCNADLSSRNVELMKRGLNHSLWQENKNTNSSIVQPTLCDHLWCCRCGLGVDLSHTFLETQLTTAMHLQVDNCGIQNELSEPNVTAVCLHSRRGIHLTHQTRLQKLLSIYRTPFVRD